MKTFRTTLFLLLPFLAMTEGGAMYQRLVNVPLWINDMHLMRHFHGVGFYFAFFTPPVILLWLVMVISGRKYEGRGKTLLKINHFFYLLIILTTFLYLVPFLDGYVGNSKAVITAESLEQLNVWAVVSMIRQVLGFVVIAVYAYMLAVVNREIINDTK